MASDKEYLEYILEASLDLRARKMMGEFLLYYRGVLVGGIYDNRLLVRPCAGVTEYLKETIWEVPYPGGSPMYLVRETDNREYLRGLFEILGKESGKGKKTMKIQVKDNQEKFLILQGKDDKTAYALLKQMIEESESSSQYVQYLDTFLKMTKDERSFIRVRGFRMACAQGVHLSTEKMKEVLGVLSDVLDEEKPTAVRQYMTSLYDLCVVCPQLRQDIIEMVDQIEPERYGESMGPLICKDIRKIRRTGK